MKLRAKPQKLWLIPSQLHFPNSPEFCPGKSRSPAGSSISPSGVTQCSRGDELPQPCPVLPLHLSYLPGSPPPLCPPLLLLLLLAACLPRRSWGKRASCLLTQTWAIVNLALALPLARMILPPPLPGRGTCRMIPQGWMGWAGDALPQTPPLAHSLQLPAPPERPWR